jgi:putative ABC transport system permease protein
MRTNLALSNISYNKARAALSVAGIGVAIVLMFMQLGFRGAVANTATTIYSKMDFDLMVTSPDYLHFVLPGQVPRDVLHQIASTRGIESVTPFHVSMANWDSPEHPDPKNKNKTIESQTRGIVVIGVDPTAPTFNADETKVTRDIQKLTHEKYILIDQKSNREYGPINSKRFEKKDIGVITNVSSKDIVIAGLFEMGAGLTANGALITNEQGFDRLLPWDSKTNVSMGLIKFHPSISKQRRREIQAELQQKYKLNSGAQQVEILTKEQVINRELKRWLSDTPIGFIFFLGVLISMIVGAAIVYMVLATDVANRLSEYATLKAMGYTNFFLSMVVLRQAIYLAIFAFVPSLILSLILYQVTGWFAKLPIFMTPGRVVFVLVLSLSMCAFSGTLALRKLWQAEPAELF